MSAVEVKDPAREQKIKAVRDHPPLKLRIVQQTAIDLFIDTAAILN